MPALYDRSIELLRSIYDRRVHDAAVLDVADRFPGHRAFRLAWPALRDEALALARQPQCMPRFHEVMAAQAAISALDQRDWRMFVVKAYGVPIRENMARCPQLAALVEAHPDVLSAALSLIAPHKHIPAHRGPFRGVLRYHLGLSVPRDELGRPATELLINGVSHRIGEGEELLWDDTFTHEVRHHAGTPRIALLLDVRRRGLPVDLALLSGMLVALVGSGVRLRRLWGHDPFQASVR